MTSLDKLRSLSRPIAFGSYSMKDDIGGVTAWLERLLLRLHGDGVPVVVLLHHAGGTGLQDSRLYARLRDAGISVEIEPSLPSGELAHPEKAVRSVLAFFNRRQPQVFLPQVAHSMYYAAQIAGRAGLPWAFVMHSDDHGYWTIAETIPVESSGGMFIGVSNYISQQAVQRRLARHPRVIPYGVPIPENTASFSGAPFRVAYSGRIVEEQKRISLVLEAMSRVCKRNPRIECWIMGDGPARASSEQWVRDQGLSERIHFSGRLEPSAVQAKLIQCQAILMMSDYEGLPVSLLEAMAAGVVPVARAIPSGIPELVKNNETGILVDATPEQAAAAIIRLANNPDLWSKCSAASRSLVAERYSEEACYQRWLDVITELCERSTVLYPIAIPKKIPIPPAPPVRWRLNRALNPIRQWLIKQWHCILLPVALFPRNCFRRLYRAIKR